MATLSFTPLSSPFPCAPSLRLTTAATSRAATFLAAKRLLNATNLSLITAPGAPKQAPQSRRITCQAGSIDKNETVAAGEQKVSEVKESVSEKSGPPFLTIVAGIIVAALVLWGLWSVVSAILGIFFH